MVDSAVYRLVLAPPRGIHHSIGAERSRMSSVSRHKVVGRHAVAQCLQRNSTLDAREQVAARSKFGGVPEPSNAMLSSSSAVRRTSRVPNSDRSGQF